jgi:hypothetical protein
LRLLICCAWYGVSEGDVGVGDEVAVDVEDDDVDASGRGLLEGAAGWCLGKSSGCVLCGGVLRQAAESEAEDDSDGS